MNYSSSIYRMIKKRARSSEEKAWFIVSHQSGSNSILTWEEIGIDSEEDRKSDYDSDQDNETHPDPFIIDIKKDTDKLNWQEIEKLISKTLFGTKYQGLMVTGISNGITNMTISNEDWKESDSQAFVPASPHETLMRRSKWVHISYCEKLYLYKEASINGKPVEKLWKRDGISMKTVNSIIKWFDFKFKRSDIFSKI